MDIFFHFDDILFRSLLLSAVGKTAIRNGAAKLRTFFRPAKYVCDYFAGLSN